MKQIIFSEHAPAPIGPYSQAVDTGDTLYCSGQIALDPISGTFLDGDVAKQTNQVCQNIGAVLQAAGLGFEDVVKTTCFLVSMADFADFNEVYGTYFTGKPARSCVAVHELPKGALVEIEVIAKKN